MKDLCAYFGFKSFPFDKSIKMCNVFQSDPLKECAARFEFMKRRGGIMLLTGDPGVGKTIALRQFCESLNENLYRTYYTPLSTVTHIDLLRHLNHKLGLPHRFGKSMLFAQIQKELLESKQQRGRTILLIIDEAHLLQAGPFQELRLLTNFNMDSIDPFIFILSGQSDLRRIMEFAIMQPLAQRLSLTYHFPALTPSQSADYIRHHLALVGCKKPIFADNALAAIHEVTFGLPRRIGSIAIQALTYAMFDEKHSVDADMVLKVKCGD